MKRNMVHEIVGRWSPYEFDGQLFDVINRLKRLEEEYEERGSLYLNAEWCDYDHVDIVFTLRREETDEEFAKRKQKAEKAAQTRRRNRERKLAQQEAADRALYEKLRARFETASQ